MAERPPNLQLLIGDRSDRRSATPPPAEEAAAIIAAIASFARATARPARGAEEPRDPWLRAAILEGVSRADREDVPHPWINT